MIDSLLSRIFTSQWSIFFAVSAVLVVCAWMGTRLGWVARRKNPDGVQEHSGSLQGAVLGLLGLLLGFSFAMAVGRFDVRRALVLEEANAIGTSWLRTDFLAAPARDESRSLLKRYAEVRIEGFRRAEDPEEFTRARSEVAALHAKLWQIASASAKSEPSPVTMGYVEALNAMIDLDAARMAASGNHVPGAVWLMLMLVGGCGAWANGYTTGASGVRSVFSTWVFPLLIGIVMTLIADIDSSHRGLIGMSQKPLEKLLESMKP